VRIVLVRHGETSWNQEGRFQGQNSIELNAVGLRQAQDVAAAMRTACPGVIYSSPLARALQTAEVIGQVQSLPVTQMNGLKELNLGRAEGLNNVQMQDRYPDLMRRWRTDPAGVRMPDGETLYELQARARRAVERIKSGHPRETAIAVSHNFAIGAVVCEVLDLPLCRLHRIKLDLGSLTTLEHGTRGWRLLSLNQTLHLRPA
jgi:broad specificity phosphatase PhoE